MSQIQQNGCPEDGCENDELDATPDDPDFNWFCHWCGGLFTDEDLSEKTEQEDEDV